MIKRAPSAWRDDVAGDMQPNSAEHGCFGFSTDTPITGDWTGSGTIKIGVVRSNDSACSSGATGWYLNVAGDMEPNSYAHGCFGFPSDTPIVGDWNGSGTAKIGVVRMNDSTCPGSTGWYLNVTGDMQPNSYARGCFGFSSDIPILGDWNGSGITKIGVVRSNDSTCPGSAGWYLNVSGNMQPNSYQSGCFGFSSDVPIVGDWNGTGAVKIGVVRRDDSTCPSSTGWYLNLSENIQANNYLSGCFGFSSDTPIAGDWNGTGTTKIGVVRRDDSNCPGALGWYLNAAGDMQADDYESGCFGFSSDNPLRNQLQNFTPTPGIFRQITTQVISGASGLSGVTLTLSGTNAGGASVSQTASTDSNGNHSFSVQIGGSYTVTPSYSGYTFTPASQTFSTIAMNEVANFVVATGTSPGTPPPPSTTTPPPDLTPPPVFSGSAVNCNDISGTWTDAYNDVFSLSQTGNVVTGSTTSYDAICGDVTWTITGQVTGTGTFSLTEFSPSPAVDACGETVESGQTANVTITGCSAAQETYTGNPQGGSSFAGGGGSGSGGSSTWSRSSNPPGLDIRVDLYNARIISTLSGQHKTSNLSINLTSSDGSQSSVLNHPAAAAGNSFADTFDRTSLGNGQYGTLNASWDDVQLSVPVAFNVLGPTRFSTYNTPTETLCTTGTPVTAYVFRDGTCTYNVTTLNSVFLFQTNLNGTGASIAFDLIKPYSATSLPQSCDLPPGGTSGLKNNSGNTFVMVKSVTGSCNATVYPGSSIATNPSPRQQNTTWNCKDKVLVVNSNNGTDSIKAVGDYCPSCSADFRGQAAHIDTYSSTQACDGHSTSDYGNFTAIRLR